MKRSIQLAAAGTAAALLRIAIDSDALVVAACSLIAASLTLTYRPSIADVLRGKRRATSSDFILPLLCLSAAVLLLSSIVALLGAVFRPFPSTSDANFLTGNGIVLALCLALPAAPLLAQIAGKEPDPERVAPLWPIAVGLIGGLAIVAALGILLAMLESLLSGTGHRFELLEWPIGLALAGMIGGFGLAGWLRSLSRSQAELNTKGILAHGLKGSALLLFGAGAGLIDVALQLPKRGSTELVDHGLVGAAVLTSIMCLAWIVALLRLSANEPTSVTRALCGVVLLTIALSVTLATSASPGMTGDWAPIVLFVVVPVSIAMAVFVALIIPLLLRRVFGLHPIRSHNGRAGARPSISA